MLAIKFINYFIQMVKQKIDSEASATAQKNINVEYLEKLKIPIPLLPEQQLIVAEIERRLSVCDKLEESIRQGLEQAEALRQSILKKAFEGRLVPQDPNDEPASALLERIALVKSRGST
jgi:type I restriction enzyme S subunit